MECPRCHGKTKVIDSRPIPDGVRRRRECKKCGRRFTSHERLAPAELKVVKRHRRPTEEFQRDKLARALARVMRDSGFPRSQINHLAEMIELELTESGPKAVRSGEIARTVLGLLKTEDPEAYDRFAVDYRLSEGEWDWVFEKEADEDEAQAEQIALFKRDRSPGPSQ